MYCTIQNIKELIPSNLLSELTFENDDAIAKAIFSAEATINAYISGSYDASNAVNTAFLQYTAEKITVYNLYLTSAADETPQIVVTSYLEAISDLEKIQKGVLSLMSNSSAENPRQSEVFSNKTVSDRAFPKNFLDKF